MSAILIRVVDKINAVDIYKNVKLTKRGDVISIRPDDWVWSARENTNPAWRIFIIPVLSVSEAETSLLDPELPIDANDVRKTLQRRWHKLDVDQTLPPALRTYVNDDTRASPTFLVNLNITAVRALIVAKTRIADPAL